MKLTLISDTHLTYSGNLPLNLIPILKESDLIVHAGDFVSIECYEELKKLNNLIGVHGNLDCKELKKLLPERIVFNVEDICIGVIHRGQLNMLDTIGLGYLAREMEVDVLIFGHLHTPILESIYDNILLVCPGSPTKPRMSLPCAIELIIDGKDISGKIITLGKSYCEYIKSLSENSD